MKKQTIQQLGTVWQTLQSKVQELLAKYESQATELAQVKSELAKEQGWWDKWFNERDRNKFERKSNDPGGYKCWCVHCRLHPRQYWWRTC